MPVYTTIGGQKYQVGNSQGKGGKLTPVSSSGAPISTSSGTSKASSGSHVTYVNAQGKPVPAVDPSTGKKTVGAIAVVQKTTPSGQSYSQKVTAGMGIPHVSYAGYQYSQTGVKLPSENLAPGTPESVKEEMSSYYKRQPQQWMIEASDSPKAQAAAIAAQRTIGAFKGGEYVPGEGYEGGTYKGELGGMPLTREQRQTYARDVMLSEKEDATIRPPMEEWELTKDFPTAYESGIITPYGKSERISWDYETQAIENAKLNTGLKKMESEFAATTEIESGKPFIEYQSKEFNIGEKGGTPLAFGVTFASLSNLLKGTSLEEKTSLPMILIPTSKTAEDISTTYTSGALTSTGLGYLPFEKTDEYVRWRDTSAIEITTEDNKTISVPINRVSDFIDKQLDESANVLISQGYDSASVKTNIEKQKPFIKSAIEQDIRRSYISGTGRQNIIPVDFATLKSKAIEGGEAGIAIGGVFGALGGPAGAAIGAISLGLTGAAVESLDYVLGARLISEPTEKYSYEATKALGKYAIESKVKGTEDMSPYEAGKSMLELSSYALKKGGYQGPTYLELETIGQIFGLAPEQLLSSVSHGLIKTLAYIVGSGAAAKYIATPLVYKIPALKPQISTELIKGTSLEGTYKVTTKTRGWIDTEPSKITEDMSIGRKALTKIQNLLAGKTYAQEVGVSTKLGTETFSYNAGPYETSGGLRAEIKSELPGEQTISPKKGIPLTQKFNVKTTTKLSAEPGDISVEYDAKSLAFVEGKPTTETFKYGKLFDVKTEVGMVEMKTSGLSLSPAGTTKPSVGTGELLRQFGVKYSTQPVFIDTYRAEGMSSEMVPAKVIVKTPERNIMTNLWTKQSQLEPIDFSKLASKKVVLGNVKYDPFASDTYTGVFSENVQQPTIEYAGERIARITTGLEKGLFTKDFSADVIKPTFLEGTADVFKFKSMGTGHLFKTAEEAGFPPIPKELSGFMGGNVPYEYHPSIPKELIIPPTIKVSILDKEGAGELASRKTFNAVVSMLQSKAAFEPVEIIYGSIGKAGEMGVYETGMGLVPSQQLASTGLFKLSSNEKIISSLVTPASVLEKQPRIEQKLITPQKLISGKPSAFEPVLGQLSRIETSIARVIQEPAKMQIARPILGQASRIEQALTQAQISEVAIPNISKLLIDVPHVPLKPDMPGPIIPPFWPGGSGESSKGLDEMLGYGKKYVVNPLPSPEELIGETKKKKKKTVKEKGLSALEKLMGL